MNKKAIITSILATIIIAMSSCGSSPPAASPATTTKATAKQTTAAETAVQTEAAQTAKEVYSVSVKTIYRENLAFNKYDADIFVDGNYLYTIKQGDEKEVNLSVEPGQHTVEAYDSTDKTNHSSATFTATSSGNSFNYYITATWSRIEISQLSSSNESNMYSSSISINYKENLAVNKYNIDVYIDDEYIGDVEQGKNKMFNLLLNAGKHTIKVSEQGDNKNWESETFSVSADGYCYVFECKAKWGGINISRGKDYQIG